MQRRHRLRHLALRGGVAAVSNVLMATGLYPLLPHVLRVVQRGDRGERRGRALVGEWAAALAASAARPLGFLGLPGGKTHGPRPVIVLHGYAMSRANYVLLARRLAAAGLGPIIGFEYWTLGRVGRAARQLGELVEDVCRATGASEVDLIGHSMGGVVSRYYVALAGGDARVKNLVTLGSPHAGTDLSALGIGFPSKELVAGSTLTGRLAAAPLGRTRFLAVWSRADSLVPAARQSAPAGAEVMILDDLGHLGLLASRRVAAAIIERLK